jgi:prepilin-type N-terminal cleavage/methylation domain-containing protein
MRVQDNEKGFTIIEVIIVMIVVAIMTALSFPSFLTWYQNARYKGAARDVASILREARMRAISVNRQHRVEFDIDNTGGSDDAIQEYTMTQGNLPSGSLTWNTTINDWAGFPTGVTIKQGTGTNCNSSTDINIQFNPDGTATPVGTTNICVINNDGNSEYTISVYATTGRIKIQ